MEGLRYFLLPKGLDISRYKFGDFDGNGFVDIYMVNFPSVGGADALRLF